MLAGVRWCGCVACQWCGEEGHIVGLHGDVE